MATGVPIRRSNGKAAAASSLEYQGKLHEAEILAFPPKDYALLWGGTHNENRLYYADNLGVLATLFRDPQVQGQVRLVYIDPPFSTQTTFHSRTQNHAYSDALCGAEYVEFLRERLVLLRELLANDGSIYVHLDEKMVFHIKVIMDEVFGSENYRSCITRQKSNPKNYTSKTYGNISDYILFYTKSETYVWNRPMDMNKSNEEYRYIDADGRRYMKVPLHAPNTRHGASGEPWRGVLPPPGKHWQFPPAELEAMDAREEIYWSPSGNPRRKVYFDPLKGAGVQDIWTEFRDAHNQNTLITGYPTEKPYGLLERIIKASSNENDLVLDCFSGSGTTLEVAEDLGRKWIGIDNSQEAVETTISRFVHGRRRMGDYVRRGQGLQPPLFVEFWREPPITEFSLLAKPQGLDVLSKSVSLLADAQAR
ncbi:MAG: site-specific DNA-methyltransferase [Chloroflexi bacterium]|nr:site-specific DNA-methyltransferase [Chloroflexota bacterium]